MSKMCHLSQVSQAIAWDMPNNFYNNVYAHVYVYNLWKPYRKV